MRKFVVLLTLLICGCGSSSTFIAPVSPAQAQSVPDATSSLDLTGSLGDGRILSMNLGRTGSRLSGHGIAVEGTTGTLYTISGRLSGSGYNLKLHPNEIVGDSKMLIVSGQLEGAGNWQDFGRDTVGEISLRPSDIRGRLVDGKPGEGPNPEVFNITCSANDGTGPKTFNVQVKLDGYEASANPPDYTGTWTSPQTFGWDRTNSGQAFGQYYGSGYIVISLASNAGSLAGDLLFTLPQDAVDASVPLVVSTAYSYLVIGAFEYKARPISSGQLTIVSTGE